MIANLGEKAEDRTKIGVKEVVNEKFESFNFHSFFRKEFMKAERSQAKNDWVRIWLVNY